jgi:zinc transporter ZupT
VDTVGYKPFRSQSFGTLLMIFSLRLYLATSRNKIAIIGSVFIGISGFFFLILGAFPTQIGDIDNSLIHVINNVAAGMTGGSFTLGCLLYALYFRGDSQWKNYWVYSAITASACLFFALLWVYTPLGLQAKGLDQLLMLVSGFLWLVFISIRLLRLCFSKRNENH